MTDHHNDKIELVAYDRILEALWPDLEEFMEMPPNFEKFMKIRSDFEKFMKMRSDFEKFMKMRPDFEKFMKMRPFSNARKTVGIKHPAKIKIPADI